MGCAWAANLPPLFCRPILLKWFIVHVLDRRLSTGKSSPAADYTSETDPFNDAALHVRVPF
jgi:hypothetical protein